jgi:membrane-bound serine protease (ClpP class)
MRQLIVLALFAASVGSAATVIRVEIDRVVHPVTVEIVGGALAQAKAATADLVLIRLNTPGGLMEATRELVEMIGASPVPVVAFVAPGGARAASAGFFILLAGDVAAMAPGTRTGAASPVIIGREMDPVMRRKIESDSGAALRTMAERHGRDAALAQQTVSEAKSFTEKEALAARLVDLIAHDEADLFRQLDGRRIDRADGARQTLRLAQVQVIPYEPTLRQRLFMAISDPNIAFIMLILGALGLYIEFSSPGLIVPGVLGSILAPLGLAALSLLPIDWLGATLIVVALALFVLEAKFTSHGILGVGGAVALVLGATMLIDAPPELRISLSTAVGVALPFAAIAVFLASLVLRVHRQPVETGESGMVGKIGTVLTALDPAGKIFVHGEYWDATSTTSVPPNAKVRVVAVEGLRLRVEAVK